MVLQAMAEVLIRESRLQWSPCEGSDGAMSLTGESEMVMSL